MKLIYFFDAHIKPIFMRGKKIANPAETGIVGNGIRCIRQWEVNLWFYTKGRTTIAFDSGHLNYPNMNREFAKIGIDGKEIRHLFLTHVDVDHAGGIDITGNNIFPNAQVYLGNQEEAYLTGQMHRFRRLGLKIKNSVRIAEGYRLLQDRQILDIDGIKVQVLHIPGHTVGHCCYLVEDKILISGDCLAINQKGGYSFFDFFTQYPDLNKRSLKRLKEWVRRKNIEIICTGHSGCHKDMESCFANIGESAQFSKKRPFDQSAPYDLFRKKCVR